ncbi:PspC domain-containing protein [Dokdonella sp.]|uniref:PspC domain-containing protein n=1 Tax=Dokdonella sp. TaxID=2291710 RepID=UPI0031C4B470|nr:PspC domain-containing protein [Dokdonella sp.]
MSFQRVRNDVRARLWRDPEQGLILGVCAGLADSLACPAWLTRLAALVLAWFYLAPTVVAYLVAALLLPERPLHYSGPGDEASFWRAHRRGG